LTPHKSYGWSDAEAGLHNAIAMAATRQLDKGNEDLMLLLLEIEIELYFEPSSLATAPQMLNHGGCLGILSRVDEVVSIIG
jgi:hypothetical protein